MLLGGYAALLPVQFDAHLGEGGVIRIGLSDFVLVALIVLCARELRVVNHAWSIWHVSLLLMLPTSAVAVAMLGGRVTWGLLIAKVVGLVVLFALYATVTSTVTCWEDVWWLLRMFVGAVVVQNLVVTAVFVAGVGGPLVNAEGSRLAGMAVDPNAYGGLLVAAFALHVATVQSTRPLLTGVMSHVATATLPLSLALTASRSALIAMGAVLLVLALVRPMLWLRYVPVVALLLLVTAVTFGTRLAREVGVVMVSAVTIEQRIDMMEMGLEDFGSSPIVGVGIGQSITPGGYVIHNTPVWIMAEFGLVGLAIFLGFLANIGRRAWVLVRTSGGPERELVLGLGLAYVAMIGLSIGIEALYQRWWWLVIGLIGAIPVSSRRSMRRASFGP